MTAWKEYKRQGENRVLVEKLGTAWVIWALLGSFAALRMTLQKQRQKQRQEQGQEQRQEQGQAQWGRNGRRGYFVILGTYV
jgi:hypothetical protein